MVVTSITYRRKFNLGNYETEDYEITAQVDEGESPTEVLQKLKDWAVEQFLQQHAAKKR